MITPVSFRPTVTRNDIAFGSITRYFTKYVSSHRVVEIDKDQYNTFINSRYYTTIQIPWIVRGNLYPVMVGKNKILSLEEQNRKIVEFYDKKLPGLQQKLKNLLEFASPTINTPVAETLPSSIPIIGAQPTSSASSTPPTPEPEPVVPFEGNNGSWSGWQTIEPNITVTQLAVITE